MAVFPLIFRMKSSSRDRCRVKIKYSVDVFQSADAEEAIEFRSFSHVSPKCADNRQPAHTHTNISNAQNYSQSLLIQKPGSGERTHLVRFHTRTTNMWLVMCTLHVLRLIRAVIYCNTKFKWLHHTHTHTRDTSPFIWQSTMHCRIYLSRSRCI